MRGRPRLALRLDALALLACVALTLGIGYTVKNLCTKHAWDGFQYRSSCYNDVFSLYFYRGLDEQPVPYVSGDGELAANRDVGDLEYPSLTGILVGSVARLAPHGVGFFRLTAVALAALGIAAAFALRATAADPRRVLTFALAPSLALYAFHNWDLLAVALACVSMLAYARGADGVAGTTAGLGAAAKLYPGLLLPAFVLVRWKQTRRFPALMCAGAVAAFAAANLPFALVNRDGWSLAWRFQSERLPNFETSWYAIMRHLQDGSRFWGETYAAITTYASGALFALGAVLLIWAELRRDRPRPYALAFGILLVFLLTAKVYSPQYALWVIPFFVLVRMPWRAFAAFAVTDAGVWAAVSWFFLAYDSGRFELQAWVLEGAVYIRYLVLAWLLWLTRRAEENVIEPAEALARSR